MPRYVALLGSVNIGGRRIKMDALRLAFEPLGFSDVETFIASGNVLFTTRTTKADLLESKIEARLKEAFGFEVVTYIRTGPELAEVTKHRPFSPADHDNPAYSLYITFLKTHVPSDTEAKLKALATTDDEFAIRGREKYWLRRKSFNESKITPTMFRKALTVTGTARNITTVRRLAEMCGAG
jgi:uncharacterized protein (DUF1697 family)